jgi:hypothetical protein
MAYNPIETLQPVLIAGGLAGPNTAISTAPNQYQSAPSSFAIRTTADGVTVGAGQKVFIQNLSTTALGVKYGAGATTTSLSIVLRAGTANDDGLGGSVVIDDFIGTVTTVAMTGSPRFLMWVLG